MEQPQLGIELRKGHAHAYFIFRVGGYTKIHRIDNVDQVHVYEIDIAEQ